MEPETSYCLTMQKHAAQSRWESYLIKLFEKNSIRAESLKMVFAQNSKKIDERLGRSNLKIKRSFAIRLRRFLREGRKGLDPAELIQAELDKHLVEPISESEQSAAQYCKSYKDYCMVCAYEAQYSPYEDLLSLIRDLGSAEAKKKMILDYGVAGMSPAPAGKIIIERFALNYKGEREKIKSFLQPFLKISKEVHSIADEEIDGLDFNFKVIKALIGKTHSSFMVNSARVDVSCAKKYMLDDSEALARAAESFFDDPLTPQLSYLDDKDMECPSGKEKKQSDIALSKFFSLISDSCVNLMRCEKSRSHSTCAHPSMSLYAQGLARNAGQRESIKKEAPNSVKSGLIA